MKVRNYIVTAVMAGLVVGPMGTYADDAMDAVTPQIQETVIEAKATPSAPHNLTMLEKIGDCVAMPIRLTAGIAALCSLVYLWDRSIVLAHEGGHALAALCTGNRIEAFHVSSKFLGSGYIDYVHDRTGFLRAIQSLGGPLAGATAYFAWAKLWEARSYLCYKKEDKEMHLRAKRTGFISAACGAFLHLKHNLTPMEDIVLDETYGVAAGATTGNDGAKIQKHLGIVSPFLGAAYPYIAWAGLAAFAGYSVYRIYQIEQELKKVVNNDAKAEEAAAA